MRWFDLSRGALENERFLGATSMPRGRIGATGRSFVGRVVASPKPACWRIRDVRLVAHAEHPRKLGPLFLVHLTLDLKRVLAPRVLVSATCHRVPTGEQE